MSSLPQTAPQPSQPNSGLRNLLHNPYLQLHTAVFLWGFTAILGKLISISGFALVWYRLMLVVLVYAMIPGAVSKALKLKRIDWLRMAGAGVLVSLHWVTFYEAIKYGNVSLTLACLATTTLFTAFIEPWFTGGRVRLLEIIIALIVITGIGLILHVTDVSMTAGAIIGLISALIVSFFGVVNKILVSRYRYETLPLSLVELGTGLVVITLLMPLNQYLFPEKAWLPTTSDWGWIVVLSVFCTNIAYFLGANALKHVSAYTSALSVNMEPVYGITMAWLIFGEKLHPTFYIGTALILGAVVLYGFLARKRSRPAEIETEIDQLGN